MKQLIQDAAKKRVIKGGVMSNNVVLWKKNISSQAVVTFLKENTCFSEKGHILSLL